MPAESDNGPYRGYARNAPFSSSPISNNARRTLTIFRRRPVLSTQACISNISKSSLVAEQCGQVQSAGTSSQRVPGGMPSSGMPKASSYTKPHSMHIHFLSFMVLAFEFSVAVRGVMPAAPHATASCPVRTRCRVCLQTRGNPDSRKDRRAFASIRRHSSGGHPCATPGKP